MVLVEHHIKYIELHGIDETVWLDKGDHIALHKRLRKESKCKVTPDELNKISKKAYLRTRKGKENQLKHRKSAHRIEYNRKYKKENTHTFTSSEVVMPNVQLNESWYYNKVTDLLIISSGFSALHGKKLFYIGDDI